MKISKNRVSVGDKEEARIRAQPFMIKSVFRSLMIVIQDLKDFKLVELAVCFFANLIFQTEINEDFISQKDMTSIVGILKE